jgi:hypothetical protein
MNPIEALLDSVKLSRKQTHLNLTLVPMLASDAGEPDYLTLEEGISRGEVEITEVSEGGSVPELMLINRSVERILVVDGEELVGFSRERKRTEGQILHPWSHSPRVAEGGLADADYLTSLNNINKIG